MYKYILLVALTFALKCEAQEKLLANQRFLFTPGVTVGYTFGAYFTVGGQLNAGFNFGHRKNRLNVGGISAQYNLVLDYYSWHRITTYSLFYRNNNIDIKMGAGIAFTLECRDLGLLLEGSYHLKSLEPVSTWVGLRSFLTGPTKYFDYPHYSSAFARYQYDF
jgi:hypothetical protein